MTWGELKKKAEELGVPDEAEVTIDDYQVRSEVRLTSAYPPQFFELESDET